MIELKGKHNTAKIFTDNAEPEAVAQILNLVNQEFAAGSTIRVMPDVHAGAGCTIGTTMTVTDKIVPNLVGVDIGCGMETTILRAGEVDLPRLDEAVRKLVPAGFETRKTPHKFASEIDLKALRCAKHLNLDRAKLSVGTLGGGNHFIELDKDEEGGLWLVVHSGSRNLGKQVAEHYQKAAAEDLGRKAKDMSGLIAEMKRQGRETEIEAEIKKLGVRKVDKNLAFVEGPLFDCYLSDMAIVQRYADLNRRAIVREIVGEMGFSVRDRFTTVHNYIDTESMILRKGAISAETGERMLIPITMRDGSLVCVGKGNPDWNRSAPHGAGRLMSRSAAKRNIDLDEFKRTMEGVWSSSVGESTLDEAPVAYKPMDEIIANIGDTAEIVRIIRPVYNFKAAE
jgi:RNA-splicing ligase RtcB